MQKEEKKFQLSDHKMDAIAHQHNCAIICNCTKTERVKWNKESTKRHKKIAGEIKKSWMMEAIEKIHQTEKKSNFPPFLNEK